MSLNIHRDFRRDFPDTSVKCRGLLPGKRPRLARKTSVRANMRIATSAIAKPRATARDDDCVCICTHSARCVTSARCRCHHRMLKADQENLYEARNSKRDLSPFAQHLHRARARSFRSEMPLRFILIIVAGNLCTRKRKRSIELSPPWAGKATFG